MALWIGIAFCAFAPGAEAHGGRMKPPPEPPPDPTPEPARPKSPLHPRAPVTAGPAPNRPVPGTSVTPSTPSTPATGGPTTGRRPGGATVAPWRTTWQAWWQLNRWTYLPERHGLREAAGPVTPASDGDTLDPRDTWDAQRALVARMRIVPYLLDLLDPKHKLHDEVRSAALIALAKTTNDEAAADLILSHAEDRRRSSLVRESAALAAGLLRRTKVDRMSGARCDVMRARLLALFDDKRTPTRTRAFAAMGLGLLANQEYATPFTRDGRMVTRALWGRLEASHAQDDLAVALLTSLGLQPPTGVPEGVREGLKAAALGKRVHGRPWSPKERSHALTAYCRIEGSRCHAFLLRCVSWKRAPRELRQAAYLALGETAAGFDASDRATAMNALVAGLEHARDPLSKGLGQIALGRLVGAELRAGDARVLESRFTERLVRGARSGVVSMRSYGALALALSAYRVAPTTRAVARHINGAKALVADQLRRRRGDASVQAAYAVALGLMRAQEATPLLVELVGDARTDVLLRGHAAVALGQLGRRSPTIRSALERAVGDRRSTTLRSQAALAMALLGENGVAASLTERLAKGGTERSLAQIALALGQLGELLAVSPLVDVAADPRRTDHGRAFAIASLGLLADAEAKPSLLTLSADANYAALTDALHEVFSIL